MYHLKILIFLIATFALFAISQCGRIAFEGETRTNARRKKRPCRGRDDTAGKTFFDFNYSSVNNNYYYICGGGGGGGGGIFQKPASSGNGGLLHRPQHSGGLFNHKPSQGGGLLSGLLHDATEDANHEDDVLADAYDRPEAGGSAANPIVSIAQSVQNTVVGVTNAVTDTLQEVAKPIIGAATSAQSSPQLNKVASNGLFFGLFDGSLIHDFFGQSGSSSTPSAIVKPVTEVYDDVADPNENYKPGPQGIGNNPFNGQYTVGNSNSKPSTLVEQVNRGIDNFFNPFLDLFY